MSRGVASVRQRTIQSVRFLREKSLMSDCIPQGEIADIWAGSGSDRMRPGTRLLSREQQRTETCDGQRAQELS